MSRITNNTEQHDLPEPNSARGHGHGHGHGHAQNSAHAEGARQIAVCNACRYCEGLCAVFPAMQSRPLLSAADLDYLANVCHQCGACHYDCQYAPPHEFSINVPAVLSEIREDSYERYVWPRKAAVLFRHASLSFTLALLSAVTLFIVGFIVISEPGALFAHGNESGSFYRVMPHRIMVLLFGGVFVFSMVSIGISLTRFWKASGPIGCWSVQSLWRATRDATRLRYLKGGGMGCMHTSERPSNRRRLYHHATAGGFVLCFASTITGTIAHYLFNWQAPYPWWSPTVLLGTAGGLGLIIGPIGLLIEKRKQDPQLRHPNQPRTNDTLIWMLLLVSSTGLLLLPLRSTPAMGLLLALHLGCVFAMFAALPYSRFVHSFYRYAALIHYEHTRQQKAAKQ